KVDTTHLSAADKKALVKLLEAARVLDPLFMTQLWEGSNELYTKLQKDTTPLGRARLKYFWQNKGPWSDLDGHTAFLPDVHDRKPLGSNFYPSDMTKEEFERWVESLSKEDKEKATGFYSVVHRDASKKLTMVPYSNEYKEDLTKAAALLREAAALTDNATLKKFLTTRADSFLSDDYYDSEVAWMDLDAPIDITIGPYETYNDELFGYKASFEAYVNLRDDKETQKLGFFSQHLQEIENNLPEDPKFRNPKLGALSPIRVVNEVFASGDGQHGIMTAAYNLPNDDRVVAEKGSKRVMLKNVQEAKFNKVLLPIAAKVLRPADQKDVSFDWFFTHILAHELTHGLGPHQIKIGGRDTNPRLELKELFSAIEEAKADVTGLFALQYMIDHADAMKLQQVIDVRDKAAAERKLYNTYLASSFRTLRFGIHEAHGKGMAIQMNWLLDKGGFVSKPDGTFAVNFTKIKDAVSSLDREFLTLEATGDYAGAKKMLTEMATLRPPVQKAIDGLMSLPTDIAPQFVTADALAGGKAPRKMAKKK
ncbi:MAG: dipeptidyl-peptidase 3 family protein, partial [Terriglobales bacterium]